MISQAFIVGVVTVKHSAFFDGVMTNKFLFADSLVFSILLYNP